jgi:hypothetical protein
MSKFVIYTPDHKDYYVGQTSQGAAGWTDVITDALFFGNFERATMVAKAIAANMPNHAEPYKIFVQEVKDRQGKWRVKSEMEISPPPDRTEYYKQHPVKRANLDAPLPTDPEVSPVTYVIYRADADDYLGKVEENGNIERTWWSPHPHDAIKYKTTKDATTKARALVEYHRYELTICKLHQSEKQYWTEPLEDIFPIDPSLN